MKENFIVKWMLLPALASALAACSSGSGNWPQFRGADGNMTVKATNLPEKWGNDTNVMWLYEMTGSGWSSPIIWGDRVYISSAYAEYKSAPAGQGEFPGFGGPMPAGERMPQAGAPGQGPGGMPGGGQAPPAGSDPMQGGGQAPPEGGFEPGPGGMTRGGQAPPAGAAGQPAFGGGPVPGGGFPMQEDTSYRQDIYRWELTCIDLNTGKEIWKKVSHKGNPRGGTNPGNGYASETPVTDGERIYVYFGMIGVFCYDMDGNLLWQKDLGSYKTRNSWGTGSSPVLHEGVLYIQVDNEENSFVIALDGATGEEKWKVARDEKTTYSSPYIWRNKVRTELVLNGKTARSYDPATGELLWELKIGGAETIPSPFGDKERLYIGCPGGMTGGGPFFAVRAGASGDITPAEGELTSEGVVWADSSAMIGNATPALADGYIYMLSSRNGELSCYRAATGEKLYQEKAGPLSSAYVSPWVYNNKVYLTDERGVTQVVRAGASFEVLGQNKLDDKFWAPVAVARDAYIFKGEKKLYCLKEL